jgi:hypothetical protein
MERQMKAQGLSDTQKGFSVRNAVCGTKPIPRSQPPKNDCSQVRSTQTSVTFAQPTTRFFVGILWTLGRSDRPMIYDHLHHHPFG